MREEIEELIFHMADLKEAIKKAKHPWPLKMAYAKHRAHLRKLFNLQKMAIDIRFSSTSTSVAGHVQTLEQQNPPQTVGLEPVDGSLTDDLVSGFELSQTMSRHPQPPED